MTQRQREKLSQLKAKRRKLGGATMTMVFDLLVLMLEAKK